MPAAPTPCRRSPLSPGPQRPFVERAAALLRNSKPQYEGSLHPSSVPFRMTAYDLTTGPLDPFSAAEFEVMEYYPSVMDEWGEAPKTLQMDEDTVESERVRLPARVAGGPADASSLRGAFVWPRKRVTSPYRVWRPTRGGCSLLHQPLPRPLPLPQVRLLPGCPLLRGRSLLPRRAWRRSKTATPPSRAWTTLPRRSSGPRWDGRRTVVVGGYGDSEAWNSTALLSVEAAARCKSLRHVLKPTPSSHGGAVFRRGL